MTSDRERNSQSEYAPGERDTIVLAMPCESRFLSVMRLTVAGAAARAGLAVGDVDDLKVAASEACTNVIEHAYTDDPGGDCGITMRLQVKQGELRVEVEDQGAGFDPKRLPKVDPEQRVTEEGGLGIYLMHSLMDEVKIESAPGSGTRVVLVKRTAR